MTAFGDALAPVVAHVWTHREGYGEAVIALGLSFVRCMPKPNTPFTWETIYEWLYDSIQSAIPGSNRVVTLAPLTEEAPPHAPANSDPTHPTTK